MLQIQSIAVVSERRHARRYSALTVSNALIVLLSASESLSAAIQIIGPDLVILDCGADAEGGITILAELKALRSDVPVIFLTDASSEETVLAAFKHGAREYFRKPVDLLELQQAIEHLLSLRRKGRESGAIPKGRAPDLTSMPDELPSNLPHAIIRAVTHIKNNFNNHIYLDDLARAAHLSKYHFCRNFKQFIGLSPMRFVNLVKIRKAEVLLQRADMSISTVAYKLGFSDLSEFTRQFKNIVGVSPSIYRRSYH